MMDIQLGNKDFTFLDVYSSDKLIENYTVIRNHKILKPGVKQPSHGGGKLYLGSTKKVTDFFGELPFSINCFFLKKDFILYLADVKSEYDNPSQNYFNKLSMKDEWLNLHSLLEDHDEILSFKLRNAELTHTGVYCVTEDENFQLLRKICLPYISYFRILKVQDEQENIFFYFQPKVDIGSILHQKGMDQLLNYGLKKNITKNKKNKKIKKCNLDARDGQGKYRDQVIADCMFCPVTKIADERLLIASHIKPWSMSNEEEQIDRNNGFLLSPLIDKLFDKGFITFMDDKTIRLSRWISPDTWKKTGLTDKKYIEALPLNEERLEYLHFHQHYIFEHDCPYLKNKNRKY